MWTDVLPLILFFLAYKLKGIFAATAVAIVTGVIGSIYKYRRDGFIDPLATFTLVLIVVLGGLTLALKDPRFLIWKPTVAYAATALFFASSCRAGRIPLYKRMFKETLRLSETQYINATLGLAGYFLFAGALNLIVGYSVSLDTWVKFKVFGTMVLSFSFMFLQVAWYSKHQLPDETHPGVSERS